MICYRDRTFCQFHKECQDGKDCSSSYTEEVQEAAKKWWGNNEPPVCFYVDKPECFKEKK